MRLLSLRPLSYNLGYAKLTEWIKLIVITGVTQVLVQALGFLSGILIIRLLTIQEFAFYTLANTMLGTMVMLSDSGIANGVMSEGGKVWQDKQRLGNVLATGLNIRKRFGLISLLMTLPILAYLLIKHGANWLAVCSIILSIIPVYFAALSDSLLEIVPRLHQDIKQLQKNQTEVSLGRLILSGIFLFFLPFASVALIANGLPRIYGNIKLRQISKRFAKIRGTIDPVIRTSILKGVKRTLPIVLYASFSGQITIWILSFLGSTSSISQIGALGRIAVLFNLTSSLFAILIIPRFSRMHLQNRLLKYFLFIQALTFFISLLLLVIVWLFSNQILWIFGKDYYGLNYELFLLGISNACGLMLGVCSQLVLSRGFFLRPHYLIALNIICSILSFALFDMTTLLGVLYFSIVDVCFHYFLMFTYGVISIHRIEKGDK